VCHALGVYHEGEGLCTLLERCMTCKQAAVLGEEPHLSSAAFMQVYLYTYVQTSSSQALAAAMQVNPAAAGHARQPMCECVQGWRCCLLCTCGDKWHLCCSATACIQRVWLGFAGPSCGCKPWPCMQGIGLCAWDQP